LKGGVKHLNPRQGITTLLPTPTGTPPLCKEV